jgi:TorA maturation chaperone TorD
MDESVQHVTSDLAVDQQNPTVLQQVRNAAADDLRVLAALHDREAGPDLLAYLRDTSFPAAMHLANVSDRFGEGATLLGESLAAMGDAPEAWALDELAADYAAIYLNHRYSASPCESVWLDVEGLALQDATFQIRSWYQRFGLAVENWRTRSEDHLVAQLHFLEILLRRCDDVDIDEMARFMDEHLLRWLPQFASRVSERCATRFYAGAALLTASYCEDVRDLLAEIRGEPRPTAEEIEERMKPKAEVKAAPLVFHPGLKPSW